MNSLSSQIQACIEQTYNINGKDYSKKIIIFPCGDIGSQAISLLNNVYQLPPAYLIDNKKYLYNDNIHPASFLSQIDCINHVIILACTNTRIYDELKDVAARYFSIDNILELQCMRQRPLDSYLNLKTSIGKYSYGPICCDHPEIESIGSFCSFADGVIAVPNHQLNYITTHPMIFAGKDFPDNDIDYSLLKSVPGYFPGVSPRSCVEKRKRSTIGNDVWLGSNVIITNGADIGNGVIAGAGTVITKDIPDYAVVVGAPARIIKYRFTPEQICALNEISWWDWNDEVIRSRFDDFYIDIDDFIKKYSVSKY